MVKKNHKNFVIIAAAITVLLIGGVAAYFTGTDNATNSWTVGNVDIELTEPLYDEETDEGKTKDITPNMVVAKDPKITNTGTNDAFVFQMVSIPKATVIEAAQDGTKNAAAEIELFDYQWNDGWKVIHTYSNAVIDENATSEGPAYIASSDYNTYVVAYVGDNTNGACKALAAGETTSVLFKNIVLEGADNNMSGAEGYITFKNIIENEGLENTTLNIPVNAYGIQTTDLTADDVTDAAAVWAVLYKKTPVIENAQ